MLLFINKEQFPAKEESIQEEIVYDLNEFEWKIARGKDGYLYFGFFDENVFFIDRYLFIPLKNNDIKLDNPQYFAVNDCDYDTYIIFKDLIRKHYTDDIWDKIGKILSKTNY